MKLYGGKSGGVHRRLRPDEFGGRIQVQLVRDPGRYNNARIKMIHPSILDSLQAGLLHAYLPNPVGASSFLLPQAFKEGAPLHPAYGSGHATVAGACVTILKAWFDESETFDPTIVVPIPGVPLSVIADMKKKRTPVETNAAGNLVDYPYAANEPPLTVGGELNKLAGNISQARNAAGVHWPTDYSEALRLGEQIAIGLLQEQKPTYNEDHHLSLTKFDGTTIII